MGKLFSFMMISLDGSYEGPNHELDWPTVDDEFMEFNVRQNNEIAVLLFGRATYEHMQSYWTTEDARRDAPKVTDFMNAVPKVVFSQTLSEPQWHNTTMAGDDVAETIHTLKQEADGEIALFGSSTLTVSLLEQGLIDELRVIVNPVVLGAGPSLFAGLTKRVQLQLLRTTTFSSGNVLLCYRPLHS